MLAQADGTSSPNPWTFVLKQLHEFMAGSYVPPGTGQLPVQTQPRGHAARECFSFSPAAGEQRPPPDEAARLDARGGTSGTPPVPEVFSFAAPVAERPKAPEAPGD